MEQYKLTFFDERRIFSISQVVGEVRTSLESGFRDIWVQGEISNLKAPSSGHLYFTLKDDESQIAAVCFRSQNRYLQFRPEDGMEVVARGSITVYTPRGQLQMVVEHMEPKGRGALQIAFERLKVKLQVEGLFDPVHKKRLPLLPSKVGVVTSPSGAAIQDILRVLKNRNDRLSVLIYPARVQGGEAPPEIIRGIEYFNTRSDIDVIIVGRGGGSIEDLWAFNDESVARAIFASRIPVISAVGHEIDFTISDFVADFRAPTPSAAAEIVSGKREELLRSLTHLRNRARQSMLLLMQKKRQQWSRLATSRGLISAQSRVRLSIQRLDELRTRLQNTVPLLLGNKRGRLSLLQRDMRSQVRLYLRMRGQLMESRTRQLAAYSPIHVLERGYAIVTTPAAEIVRDPAQVGDGQPFHVRVARGAFTGRRENDGNQGL